LVFGRALDAAGKPLSDALRQEHYVEFRIVTELREIGDIVARLGTGAL